MTQSVQDFSVGDYVVYPAHGVGQINATYAKIWPNITVKGEPPADRAEWERVDDKFGEHFSPAPGKGS